MSTTINLPVLLAQLPHLAKLTSAEQSGPAHQARFSEELARQQEEHAKAQVQEVDKQEKSAVTDDRGRKDGRKEGREARREARSATEEPQDEPEAEAPAKTPWAGNIINLKI